MTPHRTYFCFIFADRRSTVVSFFPLKVYWVYFTYLLKIQHTFITSCVHFPDFCPFCSLQGLYQVLQPQINKHRIHPPNPQQMTEVFSKLLVCTKPLCTKLMIGINIYYLHMQKDIHIYFSLILSLFYKYCT